MELQRKQLPMKNNKSFAFAAVECSSGVKLRNTVKGLRLCGLLRLMALLQ
jgi:hypothetical protein